MKLLIIKITSFETVPFDALRRYPMERYDRYSLERYRWYPLSDIIRKVRLELAMLDGFYRMLTYLVNPYKTLIFHYSREQAAAPGICPFF